MGHWWVNFKLALVGNLNSALTIYFVFIIRAFKLSLKTDRFLYFIIFVLVAAVDYLIYNYYLYYLLSFVFLLNMKGYEKDEYSICDIETARNQLIRYDK